MSRFSFSLRDAAPPTVAVEIGGHKVSAARVDVRGGQTVVVAHGEELLADGALLPSLTAPNVRDQASIVSALRAVLERVGSPKRIGLIVPDPIARVSLLKFQHVPGREQDLEQLIRWQVKKAVPFPIEEAQVSYVPAGQTADGTEFIVSLARRDIVAEYESLCAAAGAHAGIVDLSTFGAINAVLAGSVDRAADWLLVNVTPDWASIAIMRGSNLIFFRNRGADGEGTLADLVHQTAMYYEDRLSGSGFGRVMLCGASSIAPQQAADVEALRRNLEERLGRAVEQIDPRTTAALTDRIGASATLLDALAPLVGLLARDREVAVIRTNLATRPFYNERAINVWIVVLAAVVAGATVLNVTRAMTYSGSNTELATRAAEDEARAAEMRNSAARLRSSVDARQIDAASVDARQANDLIDRRTFSWTELFNRFETTLPADVRITSVRPILDRERRIVLTVTVLARTVDDVNQFMERLDSTGALQNVRSTQERTNENDQIESALEMVYVEHPADSPGGSTGAANAAPASAAGERK